MRSSKTIRIVLAWTLGVSAIFGAGKGSKVVPKDASNVIRATADSADKRKFPALRALMVDAFTWSFGGDVNASQAIAEWQKEPRYLREMVRVLRKGCRLVKTDEVECPGRGGLNFRAGFIKTDKGWRMNYFVEGD